MPEECIFCRLVHDRSMVPYWIAETDRAFAFLDIRPLRPGHALVIPKTHTLDLASVSPEDWRAVCDLAIEVQRRLRQALGTTGENLLVASGPGSEQSVFHLHLHVIPRALNDDLRLTEWWESKVSTPSRDDLIRLAERVRN